MKQSLSIYLYLLFFGQSDKPLSAKKIRLQYIPDMQDIKDCARMYCAFDGVSAERVQYIVKSV